MRSRFRCAPDALWRPRWSAQRRRHPGNGSFGPECLAPRACAACPIEGATMELTYARSVADAAQPLRFQAERPVVIWAATRPVADGQSVAVRYLPHYREQGQVQDEVPAYWQYNEGGTSYWKATLPPQPAGTVLSYHLVGDSHEGGVQ